MKKGKILKAVVSAFAAVALAATTAISSLAVNTPVDEGKIVINNSATGHTYQAYQIFDGDMTVENGSYTLSNIVWGSGVNKDANGFAAAIQAVVGSDVDVTDAAVVAEKITIDNIQSFASAIGAFVTGTPAESTFADSKYTINITDPGYYLVKDKDASLDGKDDAYTRYMVQVLGDVSEISPKSDKPTVEKKVKDNDTDETTDWNDVADYEIGAAVPFKLTATMPANNWGDYETYYLKFTDTLSSGLTFNDDVKLTVNGTVITDTTAYSVVKTDAGFTVEISDVKVLGAVASSTVVVEYTATLNANAVIGRPGNTNKVDLTYSNNPNGEGNGKTPEDQVVVFTYELDTTKVDSNNNALENAKFVLKKSADGPYAIVANGKLTGWTDNKDDATTLTSDSDGLFVVKGLDEGTYYLEETEAPAGFNKLANDITLVIKAEDVHTVNYDGTNADSCLTAITLKVDSAEEKTGNATFGTVSTNVINQKGSSLPATGGIGTTIFYVGGAIVVVGAVILLIVKRRMKTEG